MESTQKIYNLQSLNFLRNMSRTKSTFAKNISKNHKATMKVGVLGGSFNPAHEGHLSISKQAIKYFHMDYVIWLVAKQNPLKSKYKDDIYTRAQKASLVADDKRILVSTIEEEFGSIYIYNTMRRLMRHFPDIDFTWLMGIDNLNGFNRWYMHDKFARLCKIIIFDRDCRGRFANNGVFMSKYKPVVDKSQTQPIISFRGGLSSASSSAIRGSKVIY